ncbi:MAG: FliH/SctL family protein [Planctomycetota bacterium]
MSNVVKHQDSEGLSGGLVFDFTDIENRADEVIKSAEANAVEILRAAEKTAEERAQEAAEKGRGEGKQAGFEEGRKEGLEAGRREAFEKAGGELRDLEETLRATIADFHERKEALHRQAQVDLLELSLLIARKVIAREIEADAHVTTDNLKRCLEVLSARKNVVVHVAPSVVETLEEALPELAKTFGDIDSVKIEADGEVSAGGCLIVGKDGSLDATVEAQLREVEDIIFGKCDE